ncbi:MAG: hypothetical protein DMF70_08320 [Acidobacteria bacterium]|nr:MAG: hypothetical protein DMF70_08320 [Acidobacteriota bacterium]
MNYLKATGLPLYLLINFGRPRVDIKRVILTTEGLAVGKRSLAL